MSHKLEDAQAAGRTAACMDADKEKPGAAARAARPGRGKKNKELGRRGEDIACIYLAENGSTVLERNWKCKAGEADIIAKDGADMVFIEVKTRSSLAAGLPEDAVTRSKRARYEGIAMHYLAANRHRSSPVRFDVISVMLMGDSQAFVRHHRDAFGVDC
jgi:putative endonuclease